MAPEQVFAGSNLTLTRFGVLVGGFDATANDIKLYFSRDGSSFPFHRSIAPPDGVILGAVRGGKRFAMAGGANSLTYCVVYGETFTGLTQMRVNCETFPALGFDGAPLPSTGNDTFPLAETIDPSDHPISGLKDLAETGAPHLETGLVLMNNVNGTYAGLCFSDFDFVSKSTRVSAFDGLTGRLFDLKNFDQPSSGSGFPYLDLWLFKDRTALTHPAGEGQRLTLLKLGADGKLEVVGNWPLPDPSMDSIPAPIFEDGFESGDTSSWSTSIGDSLDFLTFTVPFNLYFAQFAGGGGLFGQIILYALQNQVDTEVVMTLKDNDGNPLTIGLNGEEVVGELNAVIPAGGLRRFKTDTSGGVKVGSVTVASNRRLAGVVVFGGASGLAGVGASAPLEGFSAPMETNDQEQTNTGIAIMSLEEEEVTLELRLCDRDDELVASAQIKLVMMGHLAKFLNEFPWDEADLDLTDFEGTLKVTATGRIAATVIQTRPDQFATMPVAEL